MAISGGLVFSVEVILGEWSALNIIPVAIASVAGAETARLLEGNQIVFDHHLFHIGMIHLDDIRSYLFNPGLYDAVLVGEIADSNVETIGLEDDLPEVLQKMDVRRLFSMPVVINRKFVGMLSKATLLDRYRKELMVQTSYK